MVQDRVVPALRVSGRNVRDLTGACFGEWSVLAFVGTEGRKARWLARCSCGAVRVLAGNALLTGSSRSCGCVGDAAFARALTKHGHAGDGRTGRSPTYQSWQAMLDRCDNPGRVHSHRYVDRGIAVAPRWRDFAAFLADMGERPADLWLERIDNDRGYEPGNCKWATPVEQQANKCSNFIVEYRGESAPLVTWARRLNLSYQTLTSRLRKQGMSTAQAFETPGIGPFKSSRGTRGAR